MQPCPLFFHPDMAAALGVLQVPAKPGLHPQGQETQGHHTVGLALHPTPEALLEGVASTGRASAHDLRELRIHRSKGTGRLYGSPMSASPPECMRTTLGKQEFN